ncbi:MAG: hypothetical protein JSS74_11605, partial [Actinobacteria bacterium]|nr:hypothetical protein [Actinomycetota bacterium]
MRRIYPESEGAKVPHLGRRLGVRTINVARGTELLSDLNGGFNNVQEHLDLGVTQLTSQVIDVEVPPPAVEFRPRDDECANRPRLV